MQLRSITINVAFLMVLGTLCVGVFWFVLHTRESQGLYSDVRFSELSHSPAPPFSATTLDGKTFMSTTIKKPLLLEVFASWCDICESEIPILNKIAREYPAIDVLAVSGSMKGMGLRPESTKDLRVYRTEKHVMYNIAFDPSMQVASHYRVTGFPSIYVIRKDGIVNFDVAGSISFDDLQKKIYEAENAAK